MTMSSSYPYAVNYNDHFETPQTAYRDVLPLFDAVQPLIPSSDNDDNSNSPTRSKHIIYDPFYCDGRTKRILQLFGFDKVIHQKRDFYKDVKANNVPEHHTFVTNPPYSDDHKERCVQFAVNQFREKGTPFFILMPNYVACRNYFRSAISSQGEGIGQKLEILYVVPSVPYEYDHPEGTGKGEVPFASIWFCGVPSEKVDNVKHKFRESHGAQRNSPQLCSSLDELKALKVVPSAKRKNLKQRLKEKRRRLVTEVDSNPTSDLGLAKKNEMPVEPKKVVVNRKTQRSRSKYRDESGKRLKRRF